MITPPEEGVIEHLVGRREPVGRQRCHLERLNPELIFSGQLLKLPPERFGQDGVRVAPSADEGQEVTLPRIRFYRSGHLKMTSQSKTFFPRNGLLKSLNMTNILHSEVSVVYPHFHAFTILEYFSFSFSK